MFAKFLRRGLTIAIVLTSFSRVAAAQGSPWYGLMQRPKNVETKTFGEFSLDLPKDWQLVAGRGATLFVVAERTKKFEYGPALLLEVVRLRAAFNPAIAEEVAHLELQDVQKNEGTATAYQQQIYRQEAKIVIITQYDRAGATGGRDHVVQYSIPAGSTMYHLIGITPADQIDKAKDVFAHVAASFKPLR